MVWSCEREEGMMRLKDIAYTINTTSSVKVNSGIDINQNNMHISREQ
jgi:hypothetical protein